MTKFKEVQDEVERILLRRVYAQRVSGYTLEGSNEITRAVLLAIREPGKTAEEAGDKVAMTLAITHDSSARLTWETMIDFILNEKS